MNLGLKVHGSGTPSSMIVLQAQSLMLSQRVNMIANEQGAQPFQLRNFSYDVFFLTIRAEFKNREKPLSDLFEKKTCFCIELLLLV